MRIVLLSLLLPLTLFLMGYTQAWIHSPAPDPRCRAEGQFLLHPSNRCKYLRCTNAPTSPPVKPQKGLKDPEVGSLKLKGPRFYTLERACALGTGMALSHYVPGHSKQDRGPLDKLSVCSEHVEHNPKEGKDACTVHLGTSSRHVRRLGAGELRLPRLDMHHDVHHFPNFKTRHPGGLRSFRRAPYPRPIRRRSRPEVSYRREFPALRKMRPLYSLGRNDLDSKGRRVGVRYPESRRAYLEDRLEDRENYRDTYEYPVHISEHPGNPDHPDNIDYITYPAKRQYRLMSQKFRKSRRTRQGHGESAEQQDDPKQDDDLWDKEEDTKDEKEEENDRDFESAEKIETKDSFGSL